MATINLNVLDLCRCDVCGKNVDEVHVACGPFGPVSLAYCNECLQSGKEPYSMMVAYVASGGHFPHDINETYQKEVRRQLQLHGVSEEQFIKDVDDCIRRYEDEHNG